MYSASYLYQMLGDNKFADGAEQMAYNALPGTLTADMWARQVCFPNIFWSEQLAKVDISQYLQQTNQISALNMV